MGTDCRIYLPSRVNVRDVATAIGILLGHKAVKEPLGRDGGWHIKVEDVSVKACGGTLAECCHIVVGQSAYLYHFEFGREGKRGIMPRSTGRNIALLKKLADFFGGIVDFNDCDSTEADYFVEERFDIHGEDDAAWYRKQERFAALQPLTERDVAECVQFSAYKEAA